MAILFKNNATTTLSGSINNTQTSITVASAASFPVIAGTDYFYATMYEVSGSTEINVEIVKVTATTGATWTITRAQDGTTARSRAGITPVYIELRWTAATAMAMPQKDNNLSDLASTATARTNLGLGTMATQAANAVAITGGTISGVTLTSLDSQTTLKDNADETKVAAFEVSGIATGTTRTFTFPNASGTFALTSDLTAGYQPLDAELTAVAALEASGLIARTGAGTVSVRSIAVPAAGLTITNADGVLGNPTLALADDLAAVEAMSTTGFVKRTAANTWSAASIVNADVPTALTGKTYNALTLTANTVGFSLAGGTTSKTLTVNKNLTLDGTDGTTITLPATTGTVALNNQTMFIGTTSVAINRATANLALTGVSIDGSAGSATSATSAGKSTNLVGGNATTLLGAIPYQSAADTTTLLAPNITATKQFLSQTGTATNGAAPAWSTVSKSDVGLGSVENTALSTWVGSTAITTLGSISSGTWQGTAVAIAYGGTGATTKAAGFNALSPVTTLGDLIFGDAANSNARLAGNTTATRQFLRQTGTGAVSAAPAWDTLANGDIPSALTGKTYNALTLTANTVGFSVAGGTTSKTLTVNNSLTLSGTDASSLNIGAGGTLGSAAFTATTAYAPAAGSNSIVTVGTITAGTWTGSTIGISYGGTGATTSSGAFNALSPVTTLGDLIYGSGTNTNARLAGNTSTTKQFLVQTGDGTVSAAPAWGSLANADVPAALTGKTYDGLTLTANVTGFSVAGGSTTAKTLTVNNNLTLAGTDGSSLDIGAGGTLGAAAFVNYTPLNKAGDSTTGVIEFLDTHFLLEDNLDTTKRAQFELSGITTATTRTYTLPNASGTLALLNASQTFSSAQTFSNAVTMSGATTNIALGTSQTTGTWTAGGTAQTGAITLGQSTAAQALSIASGATTTGVTKTVNIGTNGASGSTTTITIGSSTGSTTTNLNGNFVMRTGSIQELRAVVSGTAIDLSLGNFFTRTISATTTFTVTNTPAAGTTASFILDLTNGGSATVNWWSGVKWSGGSAPTLTAAGRDVLGFFTHDAGTTWTGLVLAKDVK